ncbi:TAXI family TRAP transporter solute-binding subunit [Halovenus marina]|uniref:TAXI family TRAP transporter solute-binding subunit n=1 Tax=Halovenus marina TaxID=3396621 RepID=UPI003F5604ED
MPRISRRSFIASAGIGSVSALAGCLGSSGDTVQLTVSTAAESGSHYVMSAPLVDVLPDNTEDPELQATVSTSDGSVANMRFLHDGEADIGTTVDSIGTFAYNGEAMFEEEKEIRLMARGELVLQYYVVQEDSDIESIADLEGKTITAGPEGSGLSGQHTAYMDHLGLDVENEPMSPTEGGRALRDGVVDAWWINHDSRPVDAFANDGDNLRVVPFSDDNIEAWQEIFPGTVSRELTPDMLENYDTTTQVIGTNSFWACNPSMENDIVYAFVEAVLENSEPIQEANIGSQGLNPEMGYFDIGVPYHDGAVEYFEEEGVV